MIIVCWVLVIVIVLMLAFLSRDEAEVLNERELDETNE